MTLKYAYWKRKMSVFNQSSRFSEPLCPYNRVRPLIFWPLNRKSFRKLCISVCPLYRRNHSTFSFTPSLVFLFLAPSFSYAFFLMYIHIYLPHSLSYSLYIFLSLSLFYEHGTDFFLGISLKSDFASWF